MGHVFLSGAGGAGAESDDCTATAEQVLANFTAITKDSDDEPIKGTMPNRSTRKNNGNVPGLSNDPMVPTWEGDNLQLGADTNGVKRISIGVPRGYYSGEKTSFVNRPASDFGNATAEKVLVGNTFTSENGLSSAGKMPNRGQYQMGGFGEADDYYAINNLPEGYYSTGSGTGWAPEARCSKETVRQYLGCADPSKWVTGTIIAGQNGTMANVDSIDPAKSVVVNGSTLYIRMTNGAHITNAAAGYPEVSLDATAALTALGVQSVVNFSVAQNAPLKLQASWARPSKGPWSGIRLCAKLGSYPTGPDDSIWGDSADTYAVKTVSAGMWYVRAWNYMTWSGGRMYGSYVQGAVTIEDGSDISLGGLKLYLESFRTSKYQGLSNRYRGVVFEAGDTANYALNNMALFQVNGNPSIRLSSSTGLHAPTITLTALKTDNPSYGSSLVLAGQLKTILINQGISNITAYVAFENNVFRFTGFTGIVTNSTVANKYHKVSIHFDDATQISGGSYGLEDVHISAPVRVYFKKS